MHYGWSTYDTRTIARLQAEGRGTGMLETYLPWITVRDISSLGLSTRTKGWKTGRTHHVLSNLELQYLYCLEWSSRVTDIREQYPLPLEDTLYIAEQAGIKHPRHPQTRSPVVMTTDFLVTCERQGMPQDEARAVKPARGLASRRTLEKLEIERLYWTERRIDWGLVTESECDRILALNITLLHGLRESPVGTSLNADELADAAHLLTRETLHVDAPLRRLTSQCDRQLGLEPGTSLAIAYHLIATRQWRIDMYTPIDPTQRMVLQEACLHPLSPTLSV